MAKNGINFTEIYPLRDLNCAEGSKGSYNKSNTSMMDFSYFDAVTRHTFRADFSYVTRCQTSEGVIKIRFLFDIDIFDKLLLTNEISFFFHKDN